MAAVSNAVDIHNMPPDVMLCMESSQTKFAHLTSVHIFTLDYDDRGIAGCGPKGARFGKNVKCDEYCVNRLFYLRLLAFVLQYRLR